MPANAGVRAREGMLPACPGRLLNPGRKKLSRGSQLLARMERLDMPSEQSREVPGLTRLTAGTANNLSTRKWGNNTGSH